MSSKLNKGKGIFNRKQRAEIAKETLTISQDKFYIIDDDKIHLDTPSTKEYGPQSNISTQKITTKASSSTKIEVWDSLTISAAYQLYKKLNNDGSSICVLNFASAKNPGGGFLKGSLAQEESLSLCSNLYTAIKDAYMYTFHRNNLDALRKGLYSDYCLITEKVTVFRDDINLNLLKEPYQIQFATCPAPNAGAYLLKVKDGLEELNKAMISRIEFLLSAMALNGMKHIILGAFGCGVFKNDAVFVAESFMKLLNSERFSNVFETVIFAVPGDKYFTFKKVIDSNE